MAEVDVDAGVIRGKVVNTRDAVTFQGESVEAARAAFREAVDDDREFRELRGVSRDRPFFG